MPSEEQKGKLEQPPTEEKKGSQPDAFELNFEEVALANVRKDPTSLAYVNRLIYNRVGQVDRSLLIEKFNGLNTTLNTLQSQHTDHDLLTQVYINAFSGHMGKTCFDEQSHISKWMSEIIPTLDPELFKKFFNALILQADAEVYDNTNKTFSSWIRDQLGNSPDGTNLLDTLINIHGHDAVRNALCDSFAMLIIRTLLHSRPTSFKTLMLTTYGRTAEPFYSLCQEAKILKNNLSFFENKDQTADSDLLVEGKNKITALFKNPCQDPGDIITRIKSRNAHYDLKKKISQLDPDSELKKSLDEKITTIFDPKMIEQMTEAIQLLLEFENLLKQNDCYNEVDRTNEINKQYEKLTQSISSAESISSFITELKPFNALFSTLDKQKKLLAPENKNDFVNSVCKDIYTGGICLAYECLSANESKNDLQVYFDTALAEMTALLDYQKVLEKNPHHATKHLLQSKCDNLKRIHEGENYKQSILHTNFIGLVTKSTDLLNKLNLLSNLIKDKNEYKSYYSSQYQNIYFVIASNDIKQINSTSLQSHIDAISAFEKYKTKINASTQLISKEQATTLCLDKWNALSKILERNDSNSNAFIKSTTIPMDLIDKLNELKTELDTTPPDSLAFTAGMIVYEESKKTIQDLFKTIPFDETKAIAITKYLGDTKDAINGECDAQALLDDANNVPGTPSRCKKIIGALIILAGLSLIGLGFASIPWTAGTSAPLALYLGSTLISAGYLFATGAAITAIGATIFYKGTRQGLSKGLHDLTELRPQQLDTRGLQKKSD